MKRRAVFLDRDGTLNEDVGYPAHPSQVKIYPSSFEAVKTFNSAGMLAIIITNQSGVGRGFLTEEDLRLIHDKIRASFLEQQARLDAIYYCPHYRLSPIPRYKKDCDCRKPKPGLVLQAAQDFSLDLERSYMIGDKAEDILLAKNVLAAPILVLTGSGRETLSNLKDRGLKPACVVENILEAARWIMETEKARN